MNLVPYGPIPLLRKGIAEENDRMWTSLSITIYGFEALDGLWISLRSRFNRIGESTACYFWLSGCW